jgi:TonB-dependent starch-binding outer membrane protein SusC
MRSLCQLAVHSVAFLAASVVFAQTHAVGKVTNEKDQVVPGANIVVKGTANIAVSNAMGEFDIILPTGKQVLLVAFVGYRTVESELTVDGRKTYRVKAVIVTDRRKNRRIPGRIEILDVHDR